MNENGSYNNKAHKNKDAGVLIELALTIKSFVFIICITFLLIL